MRVDEFLLCHCFKIYSSALDLTMMGVRVFYQPKEQFEAGRAGLVTSVKGVLKQFSSFLGSKPYFAGNLIRLFGCRCTLEISF